MSYKHVPSLADALANVIKVAILALASNYAGSDTLGTHKHTA